MQRKIKVLIAEDDLFISIALKKIINRYFPCERLDVAKNGSEALGLLESNYYDIAILDWNMPVKSGDEVLLGIRSEKRTSTMPVIMLTARSDRESVNAAIKSGVTDYITKPFRQGDIVSRIERLLN